jgi:hypothetical protein
MNVSASRSACAAWHDVSARTSLLLGLPLRAALFEGGTYVDLRACHAKAVDSRPGLGDGRMYTDTKVFRHRPNLIKQHLIPRKVNRPTAPAPETAHR